MTDPLSNLPPRVPIGYLPDGKMVKMTPEFYRALRAVISSITTGDADISALQALVNQILATMTVVTSGEALIDFEDGNQHAVTTVTGQDEITTNSQVNAWIMLDETADHTDYEHMLVPTNLRCGNIVAGAGFDIHAVADFPLTGTFKVRWEWY